MPVESEKVVLAGMACRFPDASTPAALFRNGLEGRQSFRRIPPDRLPLDDYAAALVGEAHSITPVPAGLLTDWRFDAARFRVPRAAFEAADLTHWLALEVAADAIEASGGPAAFDRERTAVVVANTLTGEFSRASLLRLRWPWLDRALGEALAGAGSPDGEAAAIRSAFRDRLDAAFPPPNEESLAGGLSNTIAGRIANHFDFHAGAWSVDAACASSLVAISNAADMIRSGRAEAVVVAAVDLSLDPFELVGFSRNGALAPKRMRVFDARAEGFWPGEGAGAVVLIAREAARRRGLCADLALAGWGVATDGRGGLTRPDAAGQRRALERAYASSGTDPAELGYVEAHGTGTPIGDPTEIEALAAWLGDARTAPLPIASIKGNIGHTKAAAGLAGLIRTAQALAEGIVPPHSGCEQPHPVFAKTGHRIRVATAPEEWRPGDWRTAGVSSFGFGGVNAHVVLARPGNRKPRVLPAAPPVRDDHIFLFRGSAPSDLHDEISSLAAQSRNLSFAEVADAAAAAAGRLGRGPFSLAFRASGPEELAGRLKLALAALDGKAHGAIHFGRSERAPRIGLVFPGQSAPVRPDGGAWPRRFPGRYLRTSSTGDPMRTDNAQPELVSACLAGLDLLERLGIHAEAALGHSLGELAALAWAGSIGREDLVELAAERGRVMGSLDGGGMVRLECDRASAEALIDGLPLVVACVNAPAETVVSGPLPAIADCERRARHGGLEPLRLPVSHAFHSPMMAPAAAPLAAALDRLAPVPPLKRVASTVTGGWLSSDTDVRSLLIRQLDRPVLFDEAARALASEVDALIEVGPGAGLTRLLAPGGIPVASLDVFAEDFGPPLDALAMIFALGAEIDPRPLFEGPGIRPMADVPPSLLSSPCGIADEALPRAAAPPPAPEATRPASIHAPAETGGVLALLIRLVTEETGLDAATLSADDRFLDDLHLNSLAVSRLVARLGSALGRKPAGFRTAFANARLREVADSFDDADALGEGEEAVERVAGVAPWVRRFAIVPKPLPVRPTMALTWHPTSLHAPSLEAAEGLLIELGSEWDCGRDALPLVQLCQSAVGRYAHLAIAHRGAPLPGFARSIAAERLFESVRLIEGEADPELLGRQVDGFEEAVKQRDGGFATHALELCAEPLPCEIPPGTILVTGGARGIAAECAIRLAGRCRSPILLVGRASALDPEVATTLSRLAAAGIAARYVRCDVADAARLRRRVAAAAAELGPVTFLVHAAGSNQPAAFPSVTADLLEEALSSKCAGLAASIEACGESLARVVTFGSIIGRFGLAGEAHYALANAEQTRLLAAIAAARPGLSALAIEWSVWSGAGMGERLGVIERLAAEGVDAIDLDAALDEFETLALSATQGAIVVTSRFGSNAPLDGGVPLRFVDRPLVHTPGVELVVETRIGLGRDPYLDDHRIGGGALMPAVMLIEAMAQACAALEPAPWRQLDGIHFAAAVHAGEEDLKIRIGVLRDPAGFLRAEVRTARDGFALPCLGARFGRGPARAPVTPAAVPTPLDAAPLYGPLFFHGQRFRRVESLGGLSSRSVAATLSAAPGERWFGSFEPQTLLLGDPGLRDAALHALQCCVPHRRLVPVSAARIDRLSKAAPARIDARERWCRDDDYAFDILLVDDSGQIVERWREAVFRAIGEIDIAAVLAAAPALAQPYLERRAREATGDDSLVLALIDDRTADRGTRRDRAAAALGLAAAPARRGDGKPVPGGDGRSISFAHAEGVTIGVSAARRVGCDIESLAAFAAHELALAWTAEETLRKIGSRAPLLPTGDERFTGDGQERIVALGPVPTEGAGPVAVAVGTAP